jgi:uncharacterized protein YlxP (DUF503 family)
MILIHAIVHLDIHSAHSLKGRRNIVNSIKERLKPVNISVLDISGNYAKEADLALAWLAHDSRQSAAIRQKIERVLDRYCGELEWEIDMEEI